MIPMQRGARATEGPFNNRQRRRSRLARYSSRSNSGSGIHAVDRFLESEEEQEEEEENAEWKGTRRAAPASLLTWKVILGIVAFRCTNSLLLATYFNPDEFWQSLELAHEVAFGCGAEPTWEWRQDAMLRGYLHPFFFVVIYRVLALLHLDSRTLVILAPKLFQGILAAVSDVCIVSIVERVARREEPGGGGGGGGGRRWGWWTLVCCLSSWFLAYCLPRTFSNSLETVFTIVGLWFLFGRDSPQAKAPANMTTLDAGGSSARAARYPGPGECREQHPTAGADGLVPWGAVCFAGLSIATRPTAVVVWVGVGVGLVLFDPCWRSLRRITKSVSHRVLPAAAGVLLISATMDRWFYGTWTFPAWNFFKINVVYDVSSLYGVHSWHWYFSEGFPVICALHLPLIIVGGFLHARRRLVDGVFREHTIAKVLGGTHHSNDSEITLLQFGGMAATAPRRAPPRNPTAAERFRSIALFCVLWTVVVLSAFSAHKEYRFLLPLLPISMPLGAWSLNCWDDATRPRSDLSDAFLHGNPGKKSKCFGPRTAAAFIALAHAIGFVYLSRWHQHAPIGIMDALAVHMAKHHGPDGRSALTDLSHVAVHFLTPCHATPLHSYLHIRQSTGGFELLGAAVEDVAEGSARKAAVPRCVDLQYLQCAPDFDLEPVSRSKTDSAQFLAEPQAFVMRRYQGSTDPDVHGFSSHFRTHTLPEYFVLFSGHQDALGPFLAVHEYREVARVFHSHVPGDREAEENSAALLLFHAEAPS